MAEPGCPQEEDRLITQQDLLEMKETDSQGEKVTTTEDQEETNQEGKAEVTKPEDLEEITIPDYQTIIIEETTPNREETTPNREETTPNREETTPNREETTKTDRQLRIKTEVPEIEEAGIETPAENAQQTTYSSRTLECLSKLQSLQLMRVAKS